MKNLEYYEVHLINLASVVVSVAAESLLEAQSIAWADRASADFNSYNEDCCFVLLNERTIPSPSGQGYVTGFETMPGEAMLDTSGRMKDIDFSVGDIVVCEFENNNDSKTRRKIKIDTIDTSPECHSSAKYHGHYFDETEFKMKDTWFGSGCVVRKIE